MKKLQFVILILACLVLGIHPAFAQQKTDEGYQPVILQTSLFYPVGTNGSNVDVLNYSSINLLYGKAAALQGLEISGLGSRLTNYGMGVQVAGLGNVVENYFLGVQVAGFGNITGTKLEGLQLSGFGNITGESMEGIQVGGFLNITGQSAEGMQTAGFINIAGSHMYGMQAAGFMNIAGSDVNGLQTAGFMNIGGGNYRGIQIAGFMNVNSSFEGFQVAPFNVNGDAEGLLIGVVNVAGSINGVPIGLVTYVENGYRKLAVSGNETFYMNAAFKTGIRGLYNILSVSYRPASGRSYYGLGWGLGSEIALGKGSFMNIEATSTQVGEDELWTNKLNLLNQLKFSFGAALTSQLGVYAGPTFNVMVSEYQTADGVVGSDIAPSWDIYNKTKNGTNLKMWPGVNLGLRFL